MHQLALKVIAAHLLGDFVLQSDRMIDDIHSKRMKSLYLYLHFLIHYFLLILLTGFKGEFIFPALLLALTHLVIDMLTKFYLSLKVSSIVNLIIDQTLHLISIALFIYYYHPFSIDYAEIFSTKNQLFLISIICITFVSSIIIKKIIESFNYIIIRGGLDAGGKYIGMLERLFVFLFVISDFWEGIGFLLAAKSIFRFGDLKENKDVKMTEYILIGTLLSFSLAILIGKIYLKLL
jgi:hypothetical protein